jgi:hypothetical protein
MLGLEQERLPFMSVGIVNDGYLINWVSQLGGFHPEESRTYSCAFGADVFPQIVDNYAVEDYEKIFSIDWIVSERDGKTWKDYPTPAGMEPYLSRIISVRISPDVAGLSSSGLRGMLNARDPGVLAYIEPYQFSFIQRHDIRWI